VTHLLEKFYYPTAGTIFLDGEDLIDIDPVYLHKHIGLVSQEPVLFATSIAENIAYGLSKDEYTMEDIRRVAKLANAHEFVRKYVLDSCLRILFTSCYYFYYSYLAAV
jgi:ATP-binding cassette subfamily B (MDR/TAP) protein 1